jgi:hypothetical protein
LSESAADKLVIDIKGAKAKPSERGDLDRGPPEGLLQVKVERLSDQAAGLPDPSDHVDQAEEHHPAG